MPYIMPSLAVNADEAKGKVVAKEVVSILWVRLSRSNPSGRVDLNPSSICRGAGLAVIDKEASVDSISLEVLCSSSFDKAGTVTYKENWKNLSTPFTNWFCKERASSRATSTVGSTALFLSKSVWMV